MFDWTIDGRDIASDSPELKMKISVNSEKIQTAKLRASEWHDLHGFMATLGQRPLRISFKIHRLPGPIIGMLGSADDPAMTKQWEIGERIAAIANDMLERAGWPATKLSLDTLWAMREELEVLNSMVHEPSSLSPLSFTTKPERQSVVVDGEAVEALYFSGINLGNHFLVYAVSLELIPKASDECIDWKSSNFQFRDIARIKPTKNAYDRFITETQRRTGISSYFAREVTR